LQLFLPNALYFKQDYYKNDVCYYWEFNLKIKSYSDRLSQTRYAALLLSILLHLLLGLLFVINPDDKENFIAKSTPPHDKTPSQRLSFDLIETPRYVPQKLPSQDTDLASDVSSKAQDEFYSSDLPDGLPYNEGISVIKGYPQDITDLNKEDSQDVSRDDNRIIEPGSFFADLLKKRNTDFSEISENDWSDYNNTNASSKEFGGFSFNTYNWDFAPYLLEMKQRIRNNMNLPYAFTHLGAVYGDILVHFTVLPSGVVTKMEILDSDAHYSLEQSSINAIKNSSAFNPLPTDFPEDKLEVTAHFSFTTLKK
jgi:TonB family protein